MRLGRWIAAVGGCVLVAGGCSVQGTPESTPTDSASSAAPDRSALPAAERAAFWVDYTKRVDLAFFHGMTEPYDVRAGRKVLSGPRLAGYDFTVAYAEASGEDETPPSPRYTGLQVYSRPFTNYPKWVLAASRRTDHADGLRRIGKWNMHLFTRASAKAEWLEQEQAILASGDVPTPLEGDAAVAGAGADRRASGAAKKLVRLWEDGRRSPDLEISPKLHTVVDALTDLASNSAGDAWLTFERWPELPTRSVRATGTTLSMLAFRVTLHQQATAGTYLYWTGTMADLLGSGHSSSLSRDFVVTVLLSLPDGKGASDQVIGLGVDALLDKAS
jgi:hypothetical protein